MMHSTPVVIASGTVPTLGAISRSMVLPSSIPAGSHTLIFTATSNTGKKVVQRAWFAVTAAKTVAAISKTGPVTAPATHTPPTEGGLASTGFAALPLIGAAGALLVLGLVLLVLSRRRRPGTDAH